ncbi:DNA replication/repair protein RecF [Sphingomonas sp.]|uniref:DNA replication/repair protein RecF n=1 Tax=Sphingomonas sp. TaxID=28214 RepID=UPI0025E2B575|nr:DNA replication/repair protein RecF [Sphingomonas sp.]
MAIVRLSLGDFRSYPDALVEVGSGIVVLTGDNGAGKTNILEAVSLFAPGRGLRGAPFREMARTDGGGGFSVAARLVPRAGETSVDLGTGSEPTTPDRRIVRVNGAASPSTALGEWLSLVWLTPAMDRIFADAAGERRRFLDRLVLARNPGHAHHATRYEAAMRQRNRLLTDEAPDAEWLAALEAAMVEHGVALAAARQALVDELGQRIAAEPAGPFARAGLTLAGWTCENFARDLREGRVRDAAAGRTLTGPHRQDLMVTHIDKGQAAARCSTGEQKALLIGIVLAHADLVADAIGRAPILLLDEVAAHLDPLRRAALFERISAAGYQAWLTGTEAVLFEAVPQDATRLRVAGGRLI